MKLSLTLNYTLPEGGLAPYFDALRAGRARASRCGACGWVAFPPRIRCAECGGSEHSWVDLSGRASVALRTDGTEKSFALVRFEGADGMTTLALSNPDDTSETGRLIAPPGNRPGLWLQLDGKETRDV